MRDLVIALVVAAFFVLGLNAPFLLSLGYVWTDTFYPQWISLWLFPGSSLSALMGAGALGAYMVLDRKAPPRVSATMLLMLLFVAWSSLTLLWAATPDAMDKWNWASKTMLFSVFLPFAIRSRVQIEALILIFVFSAAGHLLPWGLKTMVDGGGYNRPLGLLGVNAGAFAESSTVAIAIIMLIPILFSLRRHSLLISKQRIRDLIYIPYIITGIFGVIGSYARTGIIAGAAMILGLLLHSRHKVRFIVFIVPIAALLSVAVSAQWTSRISTIENPSSDRSADTRLVIWRWTLDYVADHPFGGGFLVHNTSRIRVPTEDNEFAIEVGRAPHSIFFEILGEHGWVGLGLFLGIVLTSFRSLGRMSRRTRGIPELAWCQDMARALRVSLLTVMAGGAFVGIAYQPTIWYLFSMSICLTEYVRRVFAANASEEQQRFPEVGLANPAMVQRSRPGRA